MNLKRFFSKLSYILFTFLFNTFIIVADASKYGRPSDFKSGSNDNYLTGVLIVFIIMVIVIIIGRIKNKDNK